MASDWDAIRRRVSEMGRASVQVGLVGDAAHAQHVGTSLKVAEVGTLHERGNPRSGLLRRSFIAATCDDPTVQAEFVALESRLIREVIAGRIGRDAALNTLGAWMAAQIKDRIESGKVVPALAPATVAAKGHSVPLLESEQLLDAIGHEIVS